MLPFTDLSPEGDQAYFGDGIAEELLDELAGMDGLRVAGRSSSFAFRDAAADARTIGNALDVATMLEGSVRKSGDRLRISAQLISVADGYTLWSKTYEQDLTDIFVIQDEIAGAVAGALGVSLGVGDVNAFRGAGTDSVEAYENYLRAMQTGGAERQRLLERAIALETDYAAALSALGLTWAGRIWREPPQNAAELRATALTYLQRAVEVEPESAYAYSLRAVASYSGFEWLASDRDFTRSLDIDSTGETLAHFANMLMRTGRSSAAIASYEEAWRTEQGSLTRVGRLWGYALLALRQFDELERAQATPLQNGRPNEGLLHPAFRLYVALNEGDVHTAQAQFGQLAGLTGPYQRYLSDLPPAFDDPAAALRILRAVYADETAIWPSKYHDIALLAAFFGDADLALESMAIEARLTTVRFGALWFPLMAEARALPGFKDLVRNVKLVEYWQARGWSDHCRPLGDDDFECF